MKSNYKTTSTILLVNRETNLMRSLTAWLKDGYCSITVANHQLITVIRFISKIYIRPWNDFANRLHLVLHAKIRIFVKFWFDPKPNAAYVSTLCSATFSVPRRAENLHGNCLYNPLWSTTDVSWWLATSQLPHPLLYFFFLRKHFIHLSTLLLSSTPFSSSPSETKYAGES